jgi:hypothetical protein
MASSTASITTPCIGCQKIFHKGFKTKTADVRMAKWDISSYSTAQKTSFSKKKKQKTTKITQKGGEPIFKEGMAYIQTLNLEK